MASAGKTLSRQRRKPQASQPKEGDRILDTQALEVSQRRIGSWDCLVSDYEIAMGGEVLAELQQTISRWLAVDPHPEDTWVQRSYGIPTLFLRFDCTIDRAGQLRIYEVEERPQGMGSSSELNPFFARQLDRVRACWPEFTSVQTPAHAARGSDDPYWVDQVPLADCPPDGLVLVRSEPFESEAWGLAGRSVSTIATEGRKRYGVDLGWWREVSDPGELPWEERFVLKPQQGSKCHEVTIWLGAGKSNRRSGAETRSRVERRLADNGVMLCQPYHEPYQVEIEGRMHSLLLRPFFGFVPQTGEWRYLGGEWLVDHGVKVHGTKTTIFGRLV